MNHQEGLLWNRYKGNRSGLKECRCEWLEIYQEKQEIVVYKFANKVNTGKRKI